MKRFIFTIITCFLLAPLFAQEFNLTLSVNAPTVQTSDATIFNSLEGTINEFFANTRWTEDYYEPQERINLNIQFTITEESDQRDYKAEMTILASRPVYNSEYESVLLNHIDRDVRFSYISNQPVQYNEGNFNDNLTSILSFYAYVILGMDGDSFSPMGGEEHFRVAEEILNLVPQNVANSVKGWRSTDNNRNRYWLIENMLTPRTKPMRQASYDYHRLGLDKMHKDPNIARVFMVESLTKIQEVDRSYPNSMIIQLFSNSKKGELLSIFKDAPPTERQKVAEIMVRLDATNARTYQPLRGN